MSCATTSIARQNDKSNGVKNMKINWNVRFHNPHFIVQLILAAVIPIMSYFGINAEDLTTWPMLFQTLINAVTNPYVCLTVAVSIYNAVVDPNSPVS